MVNELPGNTVLSVEDRFAIQELTHRYAYYIDHFELEPLLALWTRDAWFDERPVGLRYSEGIDTIREFFVDDFKVRTASAHFMTNHIVEKTGPEEAQGTCFGLIEATLSSGQSLHATVMYTDRYVHEDQRWLFRSRIVSPLSTLELGGIAESLDNESTERSA